MINTIRHKLADLLQAAARAVRPSAGPVRGDPR